MFKSVGFREADGSVAHMLHSVCTSEDLFLKLHNHFLERRSPRKWLLISDGHVSHCSLQCLNFLFWKQNSASVFASAHDALPAVFGLLSV